MRRERIARDALRNFSIEMRDGAALLVGKHGFERTRVDEWGGRDSATCIIEIKTFAKHGNTYCH